jgi:hypothetical protein
MSLAIPDVEAIFPNNLGTGRHYMWAHNVFKDRVQKDGRRQKLAVTTKFSITCFVS